MSHTTFCMADSLTLFRSYSLSLSLCVPHSLLFSYSSTTHNFGAFYVPPKIPDCMEFYIEITTRRCSRSLAVCLMIGTRCNTHRVWAASMPHCYFVLGYFRACTRKHLVCGLSHSLFCGRFWCFVHFFCYVVSSFLIPSIVTRWTVYKIVHMEFPMNLLWVQFFNFIDSCNYEIETNGFQARIYFCVCAARVFRVWNWRNTFHYNGLCVCVCLSAWKARKFLELLTRKIVDFYTKKRKF